jgi:hypothetical protein
MENCEGCFSYVHANLSKAKTAHSKAGIVTFARVEDCLQDIELRKREQIVWLLALFGFKVSFRLVPFNGAISLWNVQHRMVRLLINNL